MSVIQTIRDKAAWIIIAAIALARIAFIVQDALQGGGGGLFRGNATTLGKVNGTKIDAISFEQRYKAIETNYQKLIIIKCRYGNTDRPSNNIKRYNSG